MTSSCSSVSPTGCPESDGLAAVNTVTARNAAPDAQTRSEYVDSLGSEIDQMLFFVYGMLGLAVLIALMGIANTLSLSIHERTRELGLLRAVGQTRSEVRSTVRWESVIVAIFGTLGGIGLGVFLGWGLMRALVAQEGFGDVRRAGQLAGRRPRPRRARRCRRSVATRRDVPASSTSCRPSRPTECSDRPTCSDSRIPTDE